MNPKLLAPPSADRLVCARRLRGFVRQRNASVAVGYVGGLDERRLRERPQGGGRRIGSQACGPQVTSPQWRVQTVGVQPLSINRLCQSSSGVEQRTHKPLVGGSIPSSGTN